MKKFLVLFAFVGLSLIACKNDDVIEPDVEPGVPAVSVELNATSFLPGDVMVATINDISDEGVERDAITLNFSVTDSETGLSAEEMFVDFTESAILGVNEPETTVEFTVGVEITETSYLKFSTTTNDNCTIDGNSYDITVGTAYVVSLSVTDSEDGRVKEGETFTITATAGMAPEEDLAIYLTFESGAENYFGSIPESIVITAGETVGVSDEITVKKDGGEYQPDVTFEVQGYSESAHYVVDNVIIITRQDADNYLYDETWVYPNPSQSFVSSSLLNTYNSYGNSSNYVVMKGAIDGSGDPHPNPELAAQGWTLVNATEFHYIPLGYGYPCTPPDYTENHPDFTMYGDWGNNFVTVQNGWSEESTTAMQEYSYTDYEKFTNVTEDGYLRIWSAYSAGQTNACNLGAHSDREIGMAAIKGNSTNASSSYSYPSWWATVGEGTRIEIRARMGGKRQGFNCLMRLLGNSGRDWPANGQISILENPIYLSTPNDDWIQQSCYWGSKKTHTAKSSDTLYINNQNWNIYWAEIVDNSHVNVGINGVTTVSIEDDGEYSWVFDDDSSGQGFYLLIAPKPADAVLEEDGYSDDALMSGAWADPDFATISYEESKTSDDSPHIEIDWIRVWRNSNYNEIKPKLYDDVLFF